MEKKAADGQGRNVFKLEEKYVMSKGRKRENEWGNYCKVDVVEAKVSAQQPGCLLQYL